MNHRLKAWTANQTFLVYSHFNPAWILEILGNKKDCESKIELGAEATGVGEKDNALGGTVGGTIGVVFNSTGGGGM